jgi:hypothetical protein
MYTFFFLKLHPISNSSSKLSVVFVELIQKSISNGLDYSKKKDTKKDTYVKPSTPL